MIKRLCAIVVLLLLASCENSNSSSSLKADGWQEILGRDEGLPEQRKPIYRAKVPPGWLRKEAPRDESIVDSTKPNCEYLIGTVDNPIRLVVHSFPATALEKRIPPVAQIQRWQRQFEEIHWQTMQVFPCAQGGFTGLGLFAEGILNGKAMAVLGWGMQLAPGHFTALQAKESKHDPVRTRQRQSDYTLKATGPIDLMSAYRDEIVSFAATFELIEEIPQR